MKRFLVAMLVLLLVAAAGFAGWWWQRERRLAAFLATPFGPSVEKEVVVPPGSGPQRVSNLLAREGIVSSAEDFYLFLRRAQLGPRLRAGEYAFGEPATPEQVANKLVLGQQKTYHVTIAEGLRVDETLPLLAASELHLSLDRLTALAGDPAWVRRQGVPADRLEGFLFPDTYTFTHADTEEPVLGKLVQRALEEVRKADAFRRPGIALDLLQTVTLASIIEKETGAVEERPRISCVFHNRLRRHIPLATDPTVLYASMLRRGRFVKNITKQDLITPHPYNTYLVQGLPPGPIASPGAAALRAAVEPSACTDLYFVSRNDGTHVFCPTLTCHIAAVKVWQQDFWARQRHPGQATQGSRR